MDTKSLLPGARENPSIHPSNDLTRVRILFGCGLLFLVGFPSGNAGLGSVSIARLDEIVQMH